MKQLTLRNFFFTKLCHFALQKGSTAVTVNVLIAAEAITSIVVAFFVNKICCASLWRVYSTYVCHLNKPVRFGERPWLMLIWCTMWLHGKGSKVTCACDVTIGHEFLLHCIEDMATVYLQWLNLWYLLRSNT